MTERDFDYWTEILKTHFPGDPLLRKLGRTFVRRSPEEALRLMEIRVKECLEHERLQDYVPGFQKAIEKAIERIRAMIDQLDHAPPSAVKLP